MTRIIGEDSDLSSGESIERLPGRRTIVKGFAWGVPVVAAAIAAPAHAASGACPDPGAAPNYRAPAPPKGSRVSFAGVTTSFRVPAGVTKLRFEVAGGAGGTITAGGAGGRKVTGEIAVTPLETLTLVVGQGGAKADHQFNAVPVPNMPGGGGFGAGGNANWTAGATGNMTGGSGGGGSAILRGSTVLVIAGGGGGRTGNGFQTNDGWDGSSTQLTNRGDSASGRTVTTGNGTFSAAAPTFGVAGVPGSASGPGLIQTERLAGRNGGLFVTGQGGRGGDSVQLAMAHNSDHLSVVSGAGGGGYRGGASGSVTGGAYNVSGSAPATLAIVGGFGTWGENYLSAAVMAGAVGPAGNSVTEVEYRSPGWINIWYCV